MKDTIEITITREDAEKAGEYQDIRDCLLLTVFKKVFPKNIIEFSKGICSIKVGNDIYSILPVTERTIQSLYLQPSLKEINLENFKPFTFTATKV